MAITVGNIGAASHTVSSTDITPTLPSHSEGDLLLAFAGRRSATAQGTPTLSEGSATWTKLHEFQDRTMVAWAKKAGASESNPTFSHSNNSSSNPWSAFVMQVLGADVDNLGSIVHNSTAGRSDSAATVFTFDGMTISVDGCIILDFGHAAANRTVTPTSSPAYTEAIDAGTALGNGGTLFVQYRIQTTATDTSSHTAGLSSSTVANTFSIALKPASAGGVGAARHYYRNVLGK